VEVCPGNRDVRAIRHGAAAMKYVRGIGMNLWIADGEDGPSMSGESVVGAWRKYVRSIVSAVKGRSGGGTGPSMSGESVRAAINRGDRSDRRRDLK
jgi:hypothetical protein